jgi:deoxyribose-phosphate aldolase
MALRLEELAKTIDHTLLDPEATDDDVDRICDEARQHHFAAVCVLPSHVPRAREALRGCDVKVSSVIGHPFGGGSLKEKVSTASACVAAGAHELGLVMNLEAMWRSEFPRVREELAAVVRSVRMLSVNGGRGFVLVKVILECERLDDKLKQLACRIVELVDGDFAETTADATAGAPQLYDVELLRERLPERVAVKATGRLESLEQAQELVTAGAARLGAPNAVAVLAEARPAVTT